MRRLPHDERRRRGVTGLRSPVSGLAVIALSAPVLAVAPSSAAVASAGPASDGEHPIVMLGLLEGFWQWVGDRATEFSLSMLNVVMYILRSVPEPNLTGQGSFFTGQFSTMSQLALWLTVPVAMVAIVHAIVKGGLKEVLTTMLIGIPIAIFGGIAAIAVVEILQRITNELSDTLLNTMYADYLQIYDQMTQMGVDGGAATTASLTYVKYIQFWVFMVVGVLSLLLAAEMIFRTVGIYMAMLFIPMALAVYIWEPARKWFFTLAEIVAVLVISKFIVVATLSFGFSIMANMVTPGDFWGKMGFALAGAVTVFFATVASPALLANVVGSDGSGVNSANLRQAAPTNPDRRAMQQTAVNFLRGRGGGG